MLRLRSSSRDNYWNCRGRKVFSTRSLSQFSFIQQLANFSTFFDLLLELSKMDGLSLKPMIILKNQKLGTRSRRLIFQHITSKLLLLLYSFFQHTKRMSGQVIKLFQFISPICSIIGLAISFMLLAELLFSPGGRVSSAYVMQITNHLPHNPPVLEYQFARPF